MAERFFETDFQFGKYINERLLEVSDEEERRVLKDVLKGMLIPFYQNTEAAYQQLAKRLEVTGQKKQGRYEILTGLSQKKLVDTTDESMFPMQEEDLGPFEVDVEDMWDALDQGNRYPVMKIFLQVDYDTIRKLKISRREWKGKVYTEDGEYQGKFILAQDDTYRDQINALYPIFMENQIPWRTVCDPYLMKFFHVEMISTDCPREEDILRIVVDFEEYVDKVHYDMVPLWNIRTFDERTSAYPSLALDQIHYEHCIFKERIKSHTDYLIAAPGVPLWNVYRMDGDIHIICDEDSPMKFTLLEFGYTVEPGQYEYPVFHNGTEGSCMQTCIHTVAEIKRIVKCLGYEEWLTLYEVKQQEPFGKGKRMTYSLNHFIEDEIRTSTLRNALIFVFEVKHPGSEWNQDIMSYVISQMQWLLPEFECIGEIR